MRAIVKLIAALVITGTLVMIAAYLIALVTLLYTVYVLIRFMRAVIGEHAAYNQPPTDIDTRINEATGHADQHNPNPT